MLPLLLRLSPKLHLLLLPQVPRRKRPLQPPSLPPLHKLHHRPRLQTPNLNCSCCSTRLQCEADAIASTTRELCKRN